MSAAYTSQSTIQRSFKETLDNVVLDKRDGLEANMVMPKYLDVSNMKDAWVEDAEWGGPSFLTQKDEGAEMGTGVLTPGNTKRYVARTFAMRMIISDEAEEDGKYPEIINLAMHIKRAAVKTIEYDAASILARAWNSSYPGWDALPLFSTAHVNPTGDTYSNNLATPIAASVALVAAARTLGRRMPGRDGFIDGLLLKKVVFPPEQEQDWDEILGSEKRPDNGNFAAISFVYKMDITPVCVPYWTNTTTNTIFLTDADNGLKWKWRRKMRSKSWVTNEQEVKSYSLSYRSDSGWTDPRGAIGSGT
jgi:hypothetical protein